MTHAAIDAPDDAISSREVRVRQVAGALERFAWPACGALVIVWAIAYVTWPFSSDQGVLSWVGRIIADGGMPYRDAWEIRGPAPFLAYAAIARVFGVAQWPLRVLDLAILAAGAWCVASITSTFGNRATGRLAALVYVLWFASLGHHDTAQSDGWNGAMMAGVALLMLARDGAPRARHAALAGILIGLSVMSKPPYAAFLMLPALTGLAHVRERGARWLLAFWCAGVVAFLAAVGAVLAWLYQGGAFDAFVDVHIRWLLARYTNVQSAWLSRVQTTGVFMTADIVGTALAPAVLGVVAVWRRDRGYAVVMLAWLAAALMTVMSQGNFYPYHWLPVYPALATIAGIGVGYIASVSRMPESSAVRPIARVLGAVLLVAAGLRPVIHVYRFAFLALGILPRERYDAVEFGPYGRTGVFTHLSEYFRAHASRDERVLVWGSVPNVYYTSERRSPTRFGYTAPLINAQDDDFRRRYRAEFMRGLAANPPAYVATLSPAVCAIARNVDQRRIIGRAEERMRCPEELPEFAQWLAHGYVADTTLAPILVYRRRNLPLSNSAQDCPRMASLARSTPAATCAKVFVSPS